MQIKWELKDQFSSIRGAGKVNKPDPVSAADKVKWLHGDAFCCAALSPKMAQSGHDPSCSEPDHIQAMEDSK
jgi:hypothetical protein